MLTQLQTMTVRQFFEDVVPKLLSSKVPLSEIGRVEFRIAADAVRPGGTWLVDFDSHTVKASGTNGQKPHVIVNATPLDFMALVDGTMTPADGLLTKRLALSGDVARIDGLMRAVAAGRELLTQTKGSKP